MKIQVYDFDKTIYDGDSSWDFYVYCLKHHKACRKALPIQVWGVFLYAIGIIKKTRLKEYLYTYFRYLDQIEKDVEEFWEQKESKMKQWYLEKDHHADVIISASPEFLLWPLKGKLKVKDIIATKVNKKTGKFESENCYGKEKVNRLYKKYPNVKVNKSYSDSLSDIFILKLAEEAFIVKNDKINKLGEGK